MYICYIILSILFCFILKTVTIKKVSLIVVTYVLRTSLSFVCYIYTCQQSTALVASFLLLRHQDTIFLMGLFPFLSVLGISNMGSQSTLHVYTHGLGTQALHLATVSRQLLKQLEAQGSW